MSADLRRPPAYQTYPTDMAALEVVKLMSLAELGLLTRMQWACWSNDTIPADPAQMARVLGLPEADVRANITEAVLSFFAPTDAKGLSGRLECPELVRQMGQILERREAQSKGAQYTNATRNAKRSGKRNGQRHAPEKRRTEKNRTEKSAVREGNEEHRSFVTSYESEQAREKATPA